MSAVAILLLVSTSLYAGFQWTIRVLVYPQFAAVPTAAFAGYEQRHQQLVSIVVSPLFVFEGVTIIVAFVLGPRLPAGFAAVCCLGVLVLTAMAAVPQHRALSSGFAATTHRRLLTVDSLRLVLALGAVAAAVWYAA